MSDLELLIFGAMVSFLAAAGAYVAIRHRANETPVDSYEDYLDARGTPDDPRTERSPRLRATTSSAGIRAES
ncbi:MAG: hypothetical protein AMJ62_03370 [Myxococcales bacterium SG8_38]|nr:MAG: hypothetical protein AMJ62_03370 [Myxococcales bacterium SG8_38]